MISCASEHKSVNGSGSGIIPGGAIVINIMMIILLMIMINTAFVRVTDGALNRESVRVTDGTLNREFG